MSTPQDPGLPLDVIHRNADETAQPSRRLRFRKRFLLVFLAPVFMFAGAVMGLYFQPPLLQKFYALTGLTPGAGTETPIALPPNVELPQDMKDTMQPTDVVGLARLMPRGDVSIVAPPYGAGDARIAEILASAGDHVDKGAVVARLDNLGQLESAVLLADANVAVREAALIQTSQAVRNSRDEAKAAMEQAQSLAEEARAGLERARELFKRGVSTQAALDAAEAAERQASLAVKKAEATLARFTSAEIDQQPDVIVAGRNLDAAKADLQRAKKDMARAEVVAPISGVVLNVNARAGERPPASGIMEMGDIAHMMAEVEIYQDRIAAITEGQPVELAAAAIGQTLQGSVVSVGLTVGRQGLVSDDTAANTDARVITVMVELDDRSSEIASRYTNLEVVARIDARKTGKSAP